MKRHLLSLPAIALVLVGCDPVSERDCDVFDHPDFSQWQSDSSEAIVQYMNSEGTIVDFERQSPVLNEPFLGTDGSSNDEDVTCELSASVRLQATDNSLALTSIYLQQEQLLLKSENEALLVDHLIEAPVGTVLDGSFAVDISDDRVRVIVDPARVTYLDPDQETQEIGGQSYTDVVRINVPMPDVTTIDQSDEGSDQLRQIVIAREFGIVAFTDTEGREFVRLVQE